jgi:hypothetical protein
MIVLVALPGMLVAHQELGAQARLQLSYRMVVTEVPAPEITCFSPLVAGVQTVPPV